MTTARVIISRYVSLWTHRVSIVQKRIKRVILLQETRGEKPRTSHSPEYWCYCTHLQGPVAFLNYIQYTHDCNHASFSLVPRSMWSPCVAQQVRNALCGQHVNKHPNVFGSWGARVVREAVKWKMPCCELSNFAKWACRIRLDELIAVWRRERAGPITPKKVPSSSNGSRA